MHILYSNEVLVRGENVVESINELVFRDEAVVGEEDVSVVASLSDLLRWGQEVSSGRSGWVDEWVVYRL